MGQFGMGPDQLEEIPRPRLHGWSVALSQLKEFRQDKRNAAS